MTSGDHLWTDADARAELHVGSNAIRLAPQTAFEILELDDDHLQIRLTQGSALLRVRTLDADDNIILNTGDIITNRAVQAAREAGVLDILVDSVYAEKPKLSLEDLKAPKTGDASLESTLNGEPAVAATKPSRTRSARSGETVDTQGAVPPA